MAEMRELVTEKLWKSKKKKIPNFRNSPLLTSPPSSFPLFSQAAYYLDHKPLVNLTSKAIASQISGKTTEELREVLGTQNEPPMPASMTSHLRTSSLQFPLLFIF